MTEAQAVLLIGGLANLTFSSLAGFAVYWLRLRDPLTPPPPFAPITHTSATTGGLLLIALSMAVVHSGFTDPINLGLAAAEVLAVALSDVRNVINWRRGIVDGIADLPEVGRRLRGLGNVIHFGVITALLYGVTRTALGI